MLLSLNMRLLYREHPSFQKQCQMRSRQNTKTHEKWRSSLWLFKRFLWLFKGQTQIPTWPRNLWLLWLMKDKAGCGQYAGSCVWKTFGLYLVQGLTPASECKHGYLQKSFHLLFFCFHSDQSLSNIPVSILSTVTLPIHPPSETFHLTSFGHYWKLNTGILSTTYTQNILPTHGLITGKLQRGRRSETQLLQDKSATQSSLSFCVKHRSGTLRNSPPLSFLQGHLFSFSMFPPLKTSPPCVLIYVFFSTAL